MARDVYIQAALTSVRRLRDLLDQLTEEELHTCLKLELETRRRKHIIAELVTKLVELNRQSFLTALKEKYEWLTPNL